MSTSQKGQAGKNLIQVGRDYVRYIQINFAAGNWFVVIINLMLIGWIFYLLGSGTKWIVSIIREPQITTILPPRSTSVPTPTLTPTPTASPTPTPTPTLTPTPTASPTPTPTPTPTLETNLVFKGPKSFAVFDGLQVIIEKVEKGYGGYLRIFMKAKNNTKTDINLLWVDYYIHDNVDTTYQKIEFPFGAQFYVPASSTIAGYISFNPNPEASTITLIFHISSQSVPIKIPIK